MKRKFVVLLKILVALGLIAYLVGSKKLDLPKLSRIENWWWVLAAQFFMLTMLLVSFVRWHLLLRAQGVPCVLRDTLALGFIGFFFSQCVPGSVGGDLVKAYYVAVDHREYRAAAVTTVFLDRILGLIVLVTIAGVAIAFNREWFRNDTQIQYFSHFIVLTLIATLVAALIFFNERLRSSSLIAALVKRFPFRDLLNRVQAAVYAYKHRPGLVTQALVLSIFVHGSLILAAVCFARSFGELSIGVEKFFFIVPLVTLAISLPISPGGLGVGALAYVHFFERTGFAHGDVVAVLQRLSWYAWAIVGLVFYLLRKKKVDAAMELGNEDSQPGAVGGSIPDNQLHAASEPSS